MHKLAVRDLRVALQDLTGGRHLFYTMARGATKMKIREMEMEKGDHSGNDCQSVLLSLCCLVLWVWSACFLFALGLCSHVSSCQRRLLLHSLVQWGCKGFTTRIGLAEQIHCRGGQLPSVFVDMTVCWRVTQTTRQIFLSSRILTSLLPWMGLHWNEYPELK